MFSVPPPLNVTSPKHLVIKPFHTPWSLSVPEKRPNTYDFLVFSGDIEKMSYMKWVNLTQSPNIAQNPVGDLVDTPQSPNIAQNPLGGLVDFCQSPNIAQNPFGGLVDYPQFPNIAQNPLGGLVGSRQSPNIA